MELRSRILGTGRHQNEGRIQKELKELADDKDGIRLVSWDTKTWALLATIDAPPGTPHAGGRFSVRMVLPPDYPMGKPESVQFVAPLDNASWKMYHPNVYRDGKLCLDLIQDQWSPALTSKKLLLSILSLLSPDSYNISSPANREAAMAYKDQRREYLENARQCAMASRSPQRMANMSSSVSEVSLASDDVDESDAEASIGDGNRGQAGCCHCIQ